jgi:hypothetical protein
MYHSVSLTGEPHSTEAPTPHAVTVDDVLALVSQEQHVSVVLLKHASRCRANAARARQLAMYLCHVMLGVSLTDIGAVFQRDRTTVSYACGLIEDLREDPAARPTCADVQRRATVLLETTSFVPSSMRIRRPRWTPDVLVDRLPAIAPDAFTREDDDEIG